MFPGIRDSSESQESIGKKNFQKFDNFEINTDLTNLNPLSETSILITDDGGIALEYFIIYKKLKKIYFLALK